MGEAEVISVLIAEDDPIMRRSLSSLIGRQDNLALVGTASDADEAIALASSTRPDVAIVDVHMPGGGGERATRAIASQSPATKVLALSAFRDRSAVVGMLEAGAVGYLVKGGPVEEVLESIVAAAGGLSTLSESAFTEVVDEIVEHRSAEYRRQERFRLHHGRIKRAVEEEGRFEIVVQPIRSLDTLEIVGVEALSRFRGRPRRSPLLWFAEAEEVGLRVALELTAVRKALDRLAKLPAEIYLSINASPETAMSAQFARLLRRVATDRIVVEITEHARIDDYDRFNARLRRVRDLGARIAIDDAGAGFASLRHILLINPDIIKLDNSLISGIAHNQSAQALAAGLMSFADRIDAEIVAEGVETSDQLTALRTLGVKYGQGFHLGPPAPELDAFAIEPTS